MSDRTACITMIPQNVTATQTTTTSEAPVAWWTCRCGPPLDAPVPLSGGRASLLPELPLFTVAFMAAG